MRMESEGFRIGGELICGTNCEDDDVSQNVYELHDPSKMPIEGILFRLCSLGPAQCATCKLCAYGREYVARGGTGNIPLQNEMSEKDRAYKIAYSRAYQAKLREAGLCRRCCKKPAVPGHSYCESCAKIRREQDRARKAAKRQMVSSLNAGESGI